MKWWNGSNTEKPKVSEIKVTFVQDEDCCGRDDEDMQSLTIQAISDTCQEKPYFVLSTDRWAIEGYNDFFRLIDAVRSMLGGE